MVSLPCAIVIYLLVQPVLISVNVATVLTVATWIGNLPLGLVNSLSNCNKSIVSKEKSNPTFKHVS